MIESKITNPVLQYDPAAERPFARHKGNRFTRYFYSQIAGEISSLTRYYDAVIQWLPRREDNGALLNDIEVANKGVLQEDDYFPSLADEEERRTAILVNGTLNHHFDIQGLLANIKSRMSHTSRLIVVLYNPYVRWLYRLANWLGIRKGELPTTFLTRVDFETLAKLSGFEVVRQQPRIYFPWRLFGIGNFVNGAVSILPVIRWLGLVDVSILRPVIPKAPDGISCIIPARNERGNIENALKRLPDLGCKMEVIFVEGHSTDGTWEEIQRVAEAYRDRFCIRIFQQTGKGKADAVRLGFSRATQQVVTILDADLTMPPEMLGRFYDAYCKGLADFVNGSRLVYPMEGEAMRPLNRLGNIFFAKSLSWVLDTRLGDCLCGTKLLARHDYERIVRWRKDFGDFDPFGDFELIFPAVALGLGIVDVPVRYLARTYGSTNIRRFRHGLELLRMVSVGFLHIKLGL